MDGGIGAGVELDGVKLGGERTGNGGDELRRNFEAADFDGQVERAVVRRDRAGECELAGRCAGVVPETVSEREPIRPVAEASSPE